MCGVGVFSWAQLEGASRLANFGNRMHWDKTDFSDESSPDNDSSFYFTTAISDSAGNLLYFSNGVYLYNGDNQRLKLGVKGAVSNTCLLFKLDTCYALVILDKPDLSFHYFHANETPTPTFLHIYYLKRDSRNIQEAILDSAIRKVPFAPFIEAVKHANGKDYWIAFFQDSKDLDEFPSEKVVSPHYYRISRLNSDGTLDFGKIYPTFYQSYQGNDFYAGIDTILNFYIFQQSTYAPVSSRNNRFLHIGYQAKFSPDGQYFVFSDGEITTIFKFDRNTGELLHYNWWVHYNFYNRPNTTFSPFMMTPNKMQEDVQSSDYILKEDDFWSKTDNRMTQSHKRFGYNYFDWMFFYSGHYLVYGCNLSLNFEITADNQLIFLYSSPSGVRPDSSTKEFVFYEFDPLKSNCNPERRETVKYRVSGLLSYDLSLNNGTYQDVKLINPNTFLYYETCFNRSLNRKGFPSEKVKSTALTVYTQGGAFYDMQLMPDGSIYLINSDKFGGLSKLHTLGDSMWVEWIKDGSPQGFQGDAFSKVVSSYKLPGIKVLYASDSIICKEKGVPLSAKVLGADSVQWNTGEKGFSITAQEEGWYVASANTWYGVVKDSVYIKNAADFLRIEDVVKCPESEIKLNPKGNFLSHQLFTLEGQKRESIVDSGIYYMAYTFDGCIKYDTFEVSHHQWPEMVISQIDTGCIITEEILFMIAPDSFEYRWNGTLVSPPFYTQEFENVLEVVSHEGCKKTFAIRPESVCNTSYFIPNAFTPNDDGLNDVWRPIGEGIHEYKYKVFNRWGEKLVESGINEEFTGKDYPVGVYVFLIELKLKDGTIVYEQATLFLGR